MKIDIRSACEADAAALSHVFLVTRRKAYSWCDPDLFQDQDFARETGGQLIFVATVDDSPIGFIAISEAENFIHHLYVLPKYQNIGFGSQLHTLAIEKLKKPVKLKCVKKNHKAIAFYSRLGWEKINEGSDHTGEYFLMEYVGDNASKT